MKQLDLGDLGVFARVYRSTAGLVRTTLARLGVPGAAVDDATQDVFIVAYRRRAEFAADRAFEPWLVGIARRIAFRYRRTSARGQRKLAALEWASPAAEITPPAAAIDARRFLEQFLGELRAERREVFVLGELYGLTGPEIADRLGIPVDTAYTRLRAARRQLEQTLLAAPADDPPPRALHGGWLLLAPRLGEPSAPTLGGGLLAAILRVRVAAALLALAAVAAVPVLITPPAPAPAVAARAPSSGAPPSRPAAAVLELAPPPDSRFEALLAADPPVPAVPRAAPPVATAPADPLGAAALAAALESLEADPAAALVRLDRHARDFPASALAQARDLARVRALCRLDRVDDARIEAARLVSAGDLVRDALAGTCAAEQ